MFRRSIATFTLIATTTLFFNVAIARANFNITPPANVVPKDKKSSCATCPARTTQAPPASHTALATLGRRTQVQPLLPLQSSIFNGANVSFVSTATGRLAFAVTDLNLPGATPLMFQRTYASDRNEDTGLGRGWSFVFNDRITIDGDTATLTTADGATRKLTRDANGNRYRLQTPEPGRHQHFDLTNAGTITEGDADTTRLYQKIGEAFLLSRITIANLSAIEITHDARGRITRIANSTGSTLALEWSNSKEATLVSVTDNGGRRITFRQTGNTLRAFTDAAGAEWNYDYAGGRLVRAAEPVGRVLLRARYDRNGRTIEAGDAVGANRYSYDFASAAVSHRTTITDALGAVTAYEHTERGALASIGDDEGGTARLEYNTQNRLTRVSDSLGGDAKFVYDAANRLTRQINNDGTERSFAPNAATEGNTARDYRAAHNARGQLTSIRSNKREVTFEYDANGNETAFTYSDVGRFEKQYDAGNRVIAERLPSGLSYRREYDARGYVARESDSRGRSVRIERDASGALVGLVAANGKSIRAMRDEAGRITKLTASNGKTRRFAYDARGALTDYIDARGKGRHIKYDRRGRLQRIDDTEGVSLKYEYDRKGQLVGVRRDVKPITGATQFIRANFEPLAASVALPVQGVDCFYGDDGWDDDMIDTGFGDPFDTGGCSDPFGDKWGDGGGGGGGGETREQCIARNNAACDSDFKGCLAVAYGASVGVSAACLFGSAGFGSLACILAGAGTNMVAAYACASQNDACRLRAPNECK